MKLIKPSFELLTKIEPPAILRNIESAGRVCYKSEERITPESAGPFVRSIIARGHESVLEHQSLSVRFTCDRGVSHEIVRHRLASFSQESTRYVNYGHRGIEFVIPPWVVGIPEGEYNPETPNPFAKDRGSREWFNTMYDLERSYNQLLAAGWKPEQARSVLPNSLKTEIVVTANLREWRHILRLRTAKAAHPQMRELMQPLLVDLATRLDAVFGDIQHALEGNLK